jgi:progressive ankylosis protein
VTSRRAAFILSFWVPLAATWLMMGLEGPYIAAIVARMPDAAYNLAAYGVAFSIAWIVESPIMMLLTASNALVRCGESLHALRRFAYRLNVLLIGVLAIIALPPVFTRLAALMGLPVDIARLAHMATAVVIPWPAAIGYRRFYQGLMVRAGLTRRVAYGTVVRLTVMSTVAGALAWLSPLPGAVIGGIALTTGVLAEAVASRWMSREVVAALERTPRPPEQPPLTTSGILQFYVPLAMTSVLSLITLPVITFFMGHSRRPIESLAVLPVINAFVFLFRSGGFAYQEVAVALTGVRLEHEREVARVSWLLGGAGSALLALVAFTPLADVWFVTLSGLTPEMAAFAIGPVRILVLLPALEYLLQTQRALLILGRKTRLVTVGTGVEAVGLIVTLGLCVGWLGLPGAFAAVTAVMVGRVAANLFFHRALLAA